MSATVLSRTYFGPFPTIWERRELIRQLLIREVLQRYRGSYLGTFWSFVTPLLILAVYTFVFSTVFQVKWTSADGQGSTGVFALLLFAGLIPFNAFAETLSRAPVLITGATSYAKKMAFPLEVLPVVTVGSALFQSLVSILVLVLVTYALGQSLPVTIVLLPLSYAPLVFLCLACAWFLAATGAYVRDINQAVVPIVQVLVFASPVFYPVSAVPEAARWALYVNPLTPILEAFRAALVAQATFNWNSWVLCTIVSGALAYLGYGWFMRCKNGFSDVL